MTFQRRFLAGLLLWPCLWLTALSQTPSSSYPNYPAAMQAGEALSKQQQYDEAIKAYQSALALAGSDAERAAALMGQGAAEERVVVRIGNRRTTGKPEEARFTYLKILLLSDVPVEARARAIFAVAGTWKDSPSNARDEYTKAAQLTGLPADLQAEAYIMRGLTYQVNNAQNAQLAMSDFVLASSVDRVSDPMKAMALIYIAQIQHALKQPDKALETYGQALRLPAATDDQKAEAYYRAAEVLGGQRKFVEVRANLGRIHTLPQVSTDLRINAYRMAARSHLVERQPDLATTEMAKISQLAGIDEKKRREIFEFNGDLLMSGGALAGARAEYEKALKAPGISLPLTIQIETKIGKAFMREGDGARARATLTQAIAAPIPEIHYKGEALHLMGVLDFEEKSYPAALTSWGKVVGETRVNAAVRARAARGMIAIAEINLDYAGARSGIVLLMQILGSTTLTPDEKNQLREIEGGWRKELAEMFLKMAVEPKAAEDALISYGAMGPGLIKLDEFLRNRCHLAAGDILASQGRLTDAKLCYQRVTGELAATKPQQEEALRKIGEIEAKVK